jgi:hypothetical protein
MSAAHRGGGGPATPDHIRVEFPEVVCARCGARATMQRPDRTFSAVWSAFVRRHAGCPPQGQRASAPPAARWS